MLKPNAPRASNNLKTGVERLEERMLFSASVIESSLAALASSAEQNEASSGEIGIVSTIDNSVDGKRAFLKADVSARDRTSIYTWSVLSAPEEANVRFSRNASNDARQVRVDFDRAGVYQFQLQMTDSNGVSSTATTELKVLQVVDRITIQSELGRMLQATTTQVVEGTEQKLVATAFDQFGQRMDTQTKFAWSVDTPNATIKPNIHVANGAAQITFAQAEQYVVRASAGGVSASTNLWSKQQFSDIRVFTEDGKQITSGSTQSISGKLRAQTVDQFGNQIQLAAALAWTAESINELGEVIAAVKESQLVSSGNEAEIRLSESGRSKVRVQGGSKELVFYVEKQVPATVISTTASVSLRSTMPEGTTPLVTTPEAIGHSTSEQKVVLVDSAARLRTALASVTGGELILLKGGVNFGDFKIYRPSSTPSSMVTIRSESADHPAIISSITLERAHNITIAGVRIEADSRYSAVVIKTSSNISIENSLITANHDPLVAPTQLRNGINISGSENVQVTGNQIRRVGTGLGIGGSTNVEVSGNTFEENLKDNLNVASNNEDISIRANTFHSQLKSHFPDHHFDNIQLWVQTNAYKNSKNISITDNTIFDFGTVTAQAIFARGDYKDANGIDNPFGFENLTITGNVIVTQHSNAIAVTDAKGLTISNNTLVYAGDRNTNVAAVRIPGVRFEKSEDVRIFGNILPERPGYANLGTELFYDNSLYSVTSGEIASLLANPFADRPVRESFASLRIPELYQDGRSRGALQTAAGDKPTALFAFEPEFVGGRYLYSFDARLALPAAGQDLADATYHWTFADGTEAFGSAIEKEFASAGDQTVSLTVTDARGRSDSLVKRGIVVRDLAILRMDFDRGFEDLSGNVSQIVSTSRVGTEEVRNILPIGGNYGHLYLDSNDPDFSQLAEFRSLTLSADIKASELSAGERIRLFNRFGSWDFSLLHDGRFQLAAGGEQYRFASGINLLDGDWHRLEMRIEQDTVSFMADEQMLFSQQLNPKEIDSIFAVGKYGISIGGTGPWGSNDSVLMVDNVYLGVV